MSQPSFDEESFYRDLLEKAKDVFGDDVEIRYNRFTGEFEIQRIGVDVSAGAHA